MDTKVPRGKYVLAVSGGVDSMVLLDLLSNLPGVELVVAHFNHGIRQDSGLDEKLVAAAAGRYGRPLEIGRGRLGAKASEDTARRARYAFLEAVKAKYGADAIITAHHQDDLIETALINLLRGTKRRGLTALVDNPRIVRPLLGTSKAKILSYAKANNIKWREDTTNLDTDYLRNYLRINVLPNLTPRQREELVSQLDNVSIINRDIEDDISSLSSRLKKDDVIDRELFSLLPDKIAGELLAYWLRQDDLGEIDEYEVDRLKLALKTAAPGTKHAVKGSSRLVVGRRTAKFDTTP